MRIRHKLVQVLSLGQLNSRTAREVNGSLEWRISGPLRQPQISIGTAIRYVTEMRDKATHAVVRKNADQTLAKLKALH